MLSLFSIFVSFQHCRHHTFHLFVHNCDCKVPRASRSEIRKKAKREKGREWGWEWGGFEAGGEGEGGRGQSLNVNREKSTSLIPRSCKILWKSPEFLYGVKLLTRGEGWFENLIFVKYSRQGGGAVAQSWQTRRRAGLLSGYLTHFFVWSGYPRPNCFKSG